MVGNPISSLLPKDAEKGGDPNGFAGRVEMNKQADIALHPPTGAPKGTAMKPVNSSMDKTKSQGPYGSGKGEKRIDTNYPDSPMPKMHDGGTVPKTGPYIMKKGERVLTSDDHAKLKNAMGLAHSVLAHAPDAEVQPPPMPQHLREMHIKELHTGGFHVTKHDGKGGMTEHGAPHNDAVVGHFMDHMAHPDEDEEAVEAGDHDMHGADAEHKAIGG
jgi:hypothetical protein